MIKNKRELILTTILILLTSFVFAGYSLDINGLKTEPYEVGEELHITPLLLEDQNQIDDKITLEISDVKQAKTLTRTVDSNKEVVIPLEEDFPNGLWTIKAVYKEEEIERIFSIKEKTSVEFLIEGENLVIKNTGNVRYQKTIQITIGETKQSKTVNIQVGEQKEWKLIAPKGVYDIYITDGVKSLSKKNIQLFGTGNVIGAIDEGLIGYSGFGTTPTEDLDDKFISLNKLPLAVLFVIIVFGLGILIALERYTRRR